MNTPIVRNAPPFTPEQLKEFETAYNRDGFLLIPDILTADEVAALKAGIDRVYTDSRWESNRYGAFVTARLFETDPIFEEMLTREPIIGLAEYLVAPNCHLIAENAVRNAPGQAISQFHVDDELMFPLPPGKERHDPSWTVPNYILMVQLALTDIPTLAHGPTEFVRGSHYSGRNPNDSSNPQFEGRGPEPIFCKAGDIYLQHGQCWHRGAPNTSDETRYLFQLTYARRWVAQRFKPSVNYHMPQHVIDNADERRRRVLGFHPSGAYG